MSIVPRQIGRYYAFNVPLLAQGMGRWALWNCENLPTSPVVYLVDHEGNYIVDHLGNYIVTDDGEAWSIETSPASSWLCESLPESQILYLTDHLGNYIVDHEGNYIVSYVGVSTPETMPTGAWSCESDTSSSWVGQSYSETTWSNEGAPFFGLTYLTDHLGNYIVDHNGNYIVTGGSTTWGCEELPESEVVYLTDHLGNYIIDHNGNYIVADTGGPCEAESVGTSVWSLCESAVATTYSTETLQGGSWQSESL